MIVIEKKSKNPESQAHIIAIIQLYFLPDRYFLADLEQLVFLLELG